MSITEPTDMELFSEENDNDDYLGEEDSILSARQEVLSYADSIKLRLELVKAQQELAAMQRAAEKSKAPKENWFPSIEDFQKHSDLYGYAIGAMLWGKGRAEKENKTIAKIANALGEEMDIDVAASGIRAAVIGFQRAHKQFRFRSVAISTAAHRENTIFGPMAYAEILSALGNAILAELNTENTNPWE